MTITKNTVLIIVLVVVVILFLYFGNGAMMDGGIDGMMHENGWLGGYSRRWFPNIVILLIGVLIGWLLFRKKK